MCILYTLFVLFTFNLTMDFCIWLWRDIVPHLTDSKLFSLLQCINIQYLIQPYMKKRFVSENFQLACEKGHLGLLKCLTTTFELTREDARSFNNEAFRFASRQGHLHVLKWLTTTFELTRDDVKSDINNAFHLASKNGHLGVLQWLTATFELSREDVIFSYTFSWTSQNGQGWNCRKQGKFQNGQRGHQSLDEISSPRSHSSRYDSRRGLCAVRILSLRHWTARQ